MGICLCQNPNNIVRNTINNLLLQIYPKTVSEVQIPIENNSALSTSQKELEENINLINKSNEIKDNLEKKNDLLLEKDNKSANYEEQNNSEKINKTFVKSNSMILKPSANIYNIKDNFNIIQEQPINTFQFSKSKSLKVTNDLNRNNYYLNITNLQGHLETVIETISEVSNSRIGSKDLSKNKEIKSNFFNNNESQKNNN